MDAKACFRTSMFVYSCENSTNPSSLKVTVPEAFLQSSDIRAQMIKLQKGNVNIFLNITPPALSSYVESYNYITLPVIGNGKAFTRVGLHTYSGNTGIGEVKKGQRLIAEFTNGNPMYGLIIARC